MARRHGSKGQVLMDPAGGASPVLVASLSGWTLDMARDRADVTSFGDTNKQYVQGLPDIKGSLTGFSDFPSNQALFDAALGDTPVTLKLVPSTLDSSFFFSGLAYLDANINVAANGAVGIGGSFVAAGDWTVAP